MERPVLEGPFLVDFQSRLRARALGQIAGLLISGPGILRFSLSDETQELVKWDVTVTKLGEGTFSIAPVTPPAQPTPVPQNPLQSTLS